MLRVLDMIIQKLKCSAYKLLSWGWKLVKKSSKAFVIQTKCGCCHISSNGFSTSQGVHIFSEQCPKQLNIKGLVSIPCMWINSIQSPRVSKHYTLLFNHNNGNLYFLPTSFRENSFIVAELVCCGLVKIYHLWSVRRWRIESQSLITTDQYLIHYPVELTKS